jgi:1-acyl-sn-glycerol-3-phosphate acyltransferase
MVARIAIVTFARFLTAARGVWIGVEPRPVQRVYFANHASNGDFILIWSVLPPALRRVTRPVAAEEYWTRSPLRRFVGAEVFNAVLIQREREGRSRDPIDDMIAALDAGFSIILFPEGTRNQTDAPLLPFRAGLHRLAVERPQVEHTPVWIENLNRVMPKGEVVPIPLICTVSFGAPLRLEPGEDRADYLTRAQAALLALRPQGARAA